MKRVLFTLLILAVLAGGGWAGYFYLTQVQTASAQEKAQVETVTIGRKPWSIRSAPAAASNPKPKWS